VCGADDVVSTTPGKRFWGLVGKKGAERKRVEQGGTNRKERRTQTQGRGRQRNHTQTEQRQEQDKQKQTTSSKRRKSRECTRHRRPEESKRQERRN
jgi:hypothetical protein